MISVLCNLENIFVLSLTLIMDVGRLKIVIACDQLIMFDSVFVFVIVRSNNENRAISGIFHNALDQSID